jgi:hypothetical protein
MNQTFELLKLIIFGNAFYFLNQSNVIIFILIYIILRISPHIKIELNPSNLDIITMMFNILFLLTKIFVLQLKLFIMSINSTTIGHSILKVYNYFENLYCNSRLYILNWIREKFTKMIFGDNIKKQMQSTSLSNIKDINNFLDNLEN